MLRFDIGQGTLHVSTPCFTCDAGRVGVKLCADREHTLAGPRRVLDPLPAHHSRLLRVAPA